MPPKNKVTREQIVQAAMQMVCRDGMEILNARALAAEIGCSTQPIFSNFSTMEELRTAIIQEAFAQYHACQRQAREREELPPYKASGLAYIRFAVDRPQLFRLLFMCSRTEQQMTATSSELEEVVAIIRAATGYSHEKALRFHLEQWAFVHGIAVMLVTSYLTLTWPQIDAAMTDVYQGLRSRFDAMQD